MGSEKKQQQRKTKHGRKSNTAKTPKVNVGTIGEVDSSAWIPGSAPQYQKSTLASAIHDEVTPEESIFGDVNVPEWDEVQELFKGCVTVYQNTLQIRNLIASVKAEHANHPQLLPLVETFSTDMAACWSELTSLHAEHADRRGAPTDETDHMVALSAGASYDAWINSFYATVIPLTMDITNLITTLHEGVKDD